MTKKQQRRARKDQSAFVPTDRLLALLNEGAMVIVDEIQKIKNVCLLLSLLDALANRLKPKTMRCIWSFFIYFFPTWQRAAQTIILKTLITAVIAAGKDSWFKGSAVVQHTHRQRSASTQRLPAGRRHD
jgi:hypothetical protein